MKRLVLLLSLLPAPLLVACQEAPFDTGVPGNTSAQIVLKDAPSEELFSFIATVSEIRFREQGGAETDNLIPAPLPIEFCSLVEQFAWSTNAVLPQGTYDRLTIVFDPLGFKAIDKAARVREVVPQATEFVLDFPTPFVATGGGYARFEADLDLFLSLSEPVLVPSALALDATEGGGLGPATPIFFAPRGFLNVDNGTTPALLTAVNGVVRAFNESAGTVTLWAYADGDQTVELGTIVLLVDPFTEIYAMGGFPIPVSVFFQALAPGRTVLQFNGELVAKGRVAGNLVQIEDQDGGSGLVESVIVSGRIEDVLLDASFTPIERGTVLVEIREIVRGRDVLEAVFGGPIQFVAVEFDSQTTFLIEDDVPVPFGLLSVGQDIRFQSSSVPAPFPLDLPLLADSMVLGEERHDARMSEDQDVPVELAIRLASSGIDEKEVLFANIAPFDPAVRSGLVPFFEDVLVLLDLAEIELGTLVPVPLTRADIVPGLRLETLGILLAGEQLSDDLDLLELTSLEQPTIDARGLLVRPGRADGEVTGADPLAGTVVLSGAMVTDTFGIGVESGVLDLVLQDEAVYVGIAATEAELFEAIELLEAIPEASLGLRIEGIGTDTAQQVRAYTVFSELLTP
jgi:hypothetical protein